ncbi:signal peptidase II [Deinococcus pimensis]|uniref:signal peptidase II n=1 Tax=Deinococcus pimensis TaxID=309888 RepID=UPI0005EAF1AD|nr:signal peptidase II [Deinococcus pimensis]
MQQPDLRDAAPAVRPRSFPVWVPVALAVLLLVADQWIKAWSIANLGLGGAPRPVVPGLLSLLLTYNTGAAWSLLSGSALPLAVGRLLVGIALLVYVVVRRQDRLTTFCLSLISAGAVGNAIDGLRQGKVTDMFYSPALSSVTRAINGSEFPIFNVADSCVVVGVILLLLGSFVRPRR